MDLNYKMAPTPGITASARKHELDNAKSFAEIRIMATMIYKNPDGSPLMAYKDTLDNREGLKACVINHEIALGLVVPDQPGELIPVHNPNPPNNQPPHNGVPMSTSNVAYPPPPPPGSQAPAAYTPPQAYAPPSQPMQPAPSPYPPPGQQMQSAPPMQAAPPPPQDTGAPPPVAGRKRRAAGPVPGAVVSTPTAPQPPPGPQPAHSYSPPSNPAQPGPAAFVPQSFPAPAPAPQAFQPQQAPQAQTSAPAPVDFGPVLARIDEIGKGVAVAVQNSNDALKGLKLVHAMLHHMYMNSVNKEAPPTLPEFLKFLEKFTGPL